MTGDDISDIEAWVAGILLADTTLVALVDSVIVAGFQRSKANDYLQATNQACVGVRSVDEGSSGLGGCAFHGLSMHNHLLEIRIITMLSSTRTTNAYASQIAQRCKLTLKQYVAGQLNFTRLYDDVLTDRIELQATFRLRYITR